VSAKESRSLIQQIDAEIKKSVTLAKEKAKGKAIKQANSPYEDEMIDGKASGNVVFKFKTKAKIIAKDGKVIPNRVALFDSKGKPMIDANIWSGSEMKVSAELIPYFTAVINWCTGYNMTDSMCGFRAYKCESLKKVARLLDSMYEPQYMAAEMFIRFSKAGLKVEEVMTKKPKVIEEYRLASEALELMEKHLITVLPVVNQDEKLVGILHLHDILGKGTFKFTL
jgi:CBS domain-containing protein